MKALLTCVLLACFSVLALAADSDTAEQQITARSKAFAAAWAKADSRALGEFYAENAELVIANGGSFSGRSGIEQALSDGLNGDLRDTTITEKIDKVRLIKPDIAIVDSDISMQKPGKDEDTGKFHVVSVMVKNGDKWLTETTRVIKYTQE